MEKVLNPPLTDLFGLFSQLVPLFGRRDIKMPCCHEKTFCLIVGGYPSAHRASASNKSLSPNNKSLSLHNESLSPPNKYLPESCPGEAPH